MSNQSFTRSKDRGERIPLALVVPYVKSYIDRHADDATMVNIEDMVAEHPAWPASVARKSVGVLMLASRTGIAPGTLHNWLHSKGGECGFFDADAVLVATGDSESWHNDPGLSAHWDMAVGGGVLRFEDSEQEGSE